MTNSKHYTREGYERLYVSILRSWGKELDVDLKTLSDIQLLYSIDLQLAVGNCMRMTTDELGRKLTS